MTNYEKLCEAIGIFTEWVYTVYQFGNVYVCGKQALQENAHLFKERRTAKVKKAEKLYPIFTAEKQIELIKLLIKDFTFNCEQNRINSEFVVSSEADISFYATSYDFSGALAGIVLQLIEAGELDKDEVRRILE